ncbi:Stp1/IreP family PP2C-type Ser/Thr phosphatase, partial [Eubacteriales bacterium OttesenSCG-928-K08]|nr:Stp1/IreP family PP2C-type Ser/Thr phosphatase [Eubacteriales bacterium OttesenSCG-928-K08]
HIPKYTQPLPLVIVADGMGGHAAGARASAMAVEGIVEQLDMFARSGKNDPLVSIRTAIKNVNNAVYHAGKEPGYRGMGTTLTLALLFDDHYIASNIGDSRLYHFDGWALSQVTQDHSLVAVLVESGQITPAEADVHPQKNIITRALGTAEREEADYFHRQWQLGDTLLLCSDGLHGSLSDEEISGYLSMKLSLHDICDLLVEAALKNGATDNITVVLAKNIGGII